MLRKLPEIAFPEPALCTAVKNNEISKVSALINSGSNVNVVNLAGFSPLAIAELKQQSQIIQLLKAAGAIPNISQEIILKKFAKFVELTNAESNKITKPNLQDINLQQSGGGGFCFAYVLLVANALDEKNLNQLNANFIKIANWDETLDSLKKDQQLFNLLNEFRKTIYDLMKKQRNFAGETYQDIIAIPSLTNTSNQHYKITEGIGFVFHPDEVESLLKLILKNNRKIALSGNSHTILIQKNEQGYLYANANSDIGSFNVTDFKELIARVYASFSAKPGYDLGFWINLLAKENVVDQSFKEELSQFLDPIFDKRIKNNELDITDPYENFSSLVYAVQANNLELVEKLLNLKVRLKNNTKFSLLNLACQINNLDILKLLLKHGADLEEKNFDDYKPLHTALTLRNTEAAKLLIEKGADINYQPCAVLMELKTNNIIYREGGTPLYLAAQVGSLELVKLLLEKGANLSAACHVQGFASTPLCVAAQMGYADVTRYLLDYCKEKNIPVCPPNYSGYDHLMMSSCIQLGNLEVVKVLVEHGFPIANWFFSHVKEAEQHNQLEIAQYLKEQLSLQQKNSFLQRNLTYLGEKVSSAASYLNFFYHADTQANTSQTSNANLRNENRRGNTK